MDEKREKSLDELLSRAIDSGPVSFDAEKWKREHPDAWQAVVSRKVLTTSKESLPRVFRYRKLAWLAAAAVIIITVALLFSHRPPTEQPGPAPILRTEKSPAQMMSVLSLSMAYRRGGIEAVDEQCDKAWKMLRRKPAVISTAELLNENNGT